MITNKRLDRRAFLRGTGVAIGLPVLDAMFPAIGAEKAARTVVPKRLGVFYVPNGIHMPEWTPEVVDGKLQLKRILAPFSAHRERMLVLSGLAQNEARRRDEAGGEHARSAANYLTGVRPKHTEGQDIWAGVSMDQIAAAKLGKHTRFPSLELGCNIGRFAGTCDKDYSCIYTMTISWRPPSTPMPPELDPRQAFERMFGSGDAETPGERERRLRSERSILDSVGEDARRLKGTLGARDGRKIDEYLDSIRDVESRIQAAERVPAPKVPPVGKPEGVPTEYADYVKTMLDLLAVAYQADLTRVSTFMFCREGSTRTYRELGVPEAHHPVSHHRDDPETMEKVCRINVFHAELFAAFLRRLEGMPEGDSTVLGNSLLMYGAGLADGNRHEHHNLPLVLFGNQGGALKTGRLVEYAKETPMSNLYLSLLDIAGVPVDKLGDSTGKLNQLTGLV